jgi:hypothetical protein
MVARRREHGLTQRDGLDVIAAADVRLAAGVRSRADMARCSPAGYVS